MPFEEVLEASRTTKVGVGRSLCPSRPHVVVETVQTFGPVVPGVQGQKTMNAFLEKVNASEVQSQRVLWELDETELIEIHSFAPDTGPHRPVLRGDNSERGRSNELHVVSFVERLDAK